MSKAFCFLLKKKKKPGLFQLKSEIHVYDFLFIGILIHNLNLRGWTTVLSSCTWFLLLTIAILLWEQRIWTYKFFSSPKRRESFRNNLINSQKNWTYEWYWNIKAVEIDNIMHQADNDNFSWPYFFFSLFVLFCFLIH